MLKIRKEWCDLNGFNFIDFESLKESEEYILFLEAKIEALRQPAVVGQSEQLPPTCVMDMPDSKYCDCSNECKWCENIRR